MTIRFAEADGSDEAVPLHLLEQDALDDWLREQEAPVRRWVAASGFKAEAGSALAVPGADGGIVMALAGRGDAARRRRGRFQLAAAAARLPAGCYRLVHQLDPETLAQEALGWLLSTYRFERYRANKAANGGFGAAGAGASGGPARLVAPEGIDAAKIEAIAAGEFLTRDLINTPANDMGPESLEEACRDLAQEFGADIDCIRGDDLLARNFPLIHAVGRAAAQAPRLIDMRWGATGPRLTLVGKGVCFDTGGLNLKPGASMGLMKKDMGGAATVLGLARMIMALKLPLRLRVLIPAVENAIAGNSFRPQDILTSRKGLTVEINNTDAEGRLVLADALAYGTEEDSDLILTMATLTGAARVAVGPDLAPFFCDDEAAAQAIFQAGTRAADPVWRLPFWEPYEADIEPGVADLDNAPKGGFAGSITAALFLRRFAGGHPRYAHFDIYGWQPAAAPARPKGGVGQGARALLEALPALLELE